ncbi:hypothetical protein NDU88_001984 [Pleurodeles waltl]|uniref:Uncharacterized protein n=1 Tax=Pleurodeles waltl TaxID=8319 RepID=A0AAV7UU95_PLEWA|nr:hypothetical protein NDU88_001984 [Pleurodeles waltl]
MNWGWYQPDPGGEGKGPIPEIEVTYPQKRHHVKIIDSDAVVGWLQQPQDRLRVKSGVSVMPKEVASWSANIPELVTTEEQEEPGIEETAGRTTEQAGAEEPRRRPEDRWPRGAYS